MRTKLLLSAVPLAAASLLFFACSSSNGTASNDAGAADASGAHDTGGPGLTLDGASEASGDDGATSDAPITSGCDPDAEAPPSLPTNVCSAGDRTTRWTAMDQAPIALNPVRAAGLDLSGGDAGTGLSIDDASQTDCQPASLGDAYADCTAWSVAWGSSQEVVGDFTIATRKLFYLGLAPGYAGSMSFQSADTTNTYVLKVGAQITKNGTPITLDWTDALGLDTTVDELYRGLAATFFPAATLPTVNCVKSADCTVSALADGSGYVYVKAFGFGFRVASTTASQPTPSVVSFVDLYQR